jgi:phage terminase large subunit-like protein
VTRAASSDLDPRRAVVRSSWAPRSWASLDAPTRALRFMGQLTVPQGHGAGRRLRVRAWERDVTAGLLGDRPPVGLVSIPRGNGKSSYAGALGLYAAVADRQASPFVPCVATTEEQARRLLAIVIRYVKRHPRLAERCRVYSDRVTFPAFDDATVIALPAEPSALLGLDFSMAILDEVAAMEPSTWEAVLTAQGKRPGSVVLGIGSRVPGGTGLLDDLLAAAEREPSWRSWLWTAPPECGLYDEDAWAEANPTLDDLITRDTLRGLARTVPEPSFRAYRLNQRVALGGAWLQHGQWADIADPTRVVADGTDIVLGFDGSYSSDSSALIGCTVEEPHHIFTIGVWEKPKDDPSWRVPRHEIEAAITATFERFRVRRLACDPWGFQREISEWADRYGAEVVVEWPCNSVPRMGAATDRMYAAIQEQRVTHDGDSRLAQHVANTHVRTTSAWGAIVSKERKESPKKIDACVAAIVAYAQVSGLPKPRSKKLLTW